MLDFVAGVAVVVIGASIYAARHLPPRQLRKPPELLNHEAPEPVCAAKGARTP